jgi:hypothetical protein
MPIVPIYLNIDERTYAAVKAGALELCGMAKDTDTKRVAKHIPAVADAAKEGASKAIDFVRTHKKETFLIGGIIVVGGTVAGTVSYVMHRKQCKLNENFGNALQIYLDSARDGTLNLEILNNLINSIEAIENNTPKKDISLNIPVAQLSELIYCIFDYTVRMATANNFNAKAINCPKYFNKKTSDDLKYYLNIQKQIFEQAA